MTEFLARASSSLFESTAAISTKVAAYLWLPPIRLSIRAILFLIESMAAASTLAAAYSLS